VDFGILVLLTEVFHIHYLISAGAGFIIGTSVSYILSIYWVFSKRRLQNTHLEYWVFILIGLTGAGLNELFIWFFTEHLHIYYLFSKIISGSSVFFFNFFTRKYVLFR
jgi:putative flippase GtrA